MATSDDIRLDDPVHGRVDVLFVAGEHSGDQHAARVVAELKRRRPELNIAAFGGPELKASGAQLLYDLTASSVVGLVEVLKNYGFFRRLFDSALRWIQTHQPRVVCFVDYPGFNLRLAEALHARGVSKKGGGRVATVFYISPQIWAWKAGRRFKMAEHLDGIATIFPFEVQCYADTCLKAEFVGHPFLDPSYRSPVVYDPAGPVLLLPGSRTQAVRRIFPAMLAGFRQYGRRPGVVIYPSTGIAETLRSFDPPRDLELRAAPSHGGGEEPVRAAAVLTSSGTMSMHCALAAIPGAVVYRANHVTYMLGKLLVKVPYLGIANLLLKEEMYPEYIQGAARPSALAAELRECLENPDRLTRTRAQAQRLRDSLREPAAGTPADWLLRHLDSASKS
jgi:lipid-A-disaccharide synthase